MPLAATNNPQPPVFVQEADPGQTSIGSLWIDLTGVLKVRLTSGWVEISGGSGAVEIVSPYNSGTKIMFTVEGGIKLIVDGEEVQNYAP